MVFWSLFLDFSLFLPISSQVGQVVICTYWVLKGRGFLKGRENSPALGNCKTGLNIDWFSGCCHGGRSLSLISANWCITCSIPELHCCYDNRQEVRYCYPSYIKALFSIAFLALNNINLHWRISHNTKVLLRVGNDLQF